MFSMAQIKPQVKFYVKRRLVEPGTDGIDNSVMANPVGDIIKNRLKVLKKTQGWLAGKTGKSDTAISKWIATGKISRDNAVEVAKLLGISLDELLGTSDAGTQGAALSLVYVDREELRLLTAYREATEMGQTLILTSADAAPRRDSLSTTPRSNKS